MSDCIEWRGAKHKFGYGMKHHAGKACLVHRLEYERVYGPIPKGLCVMHSCDNPPCYNIEHLSLGTQADNQADRVRKGHVPNRKLTFDQVRAIRASREPCSAVAARLGVSRETVQQARQGRTYKIVGACPSEPLQPEG